MTTFIKEEPFPNEEEGYFNHIARMERSDEWYSDNPEYAVPKLTREYFSRVVLCLDTLDDAKVVQSRLPKVFQELPLVDIQDIIKDNIRVEPKQLIYVSTAFYKETYFKKDGFVLYPYSLITKDDKGKYTDVRDITSCKWGKRPLPPEYLHEGAILTSAVLNGEVRIEDR